LKHEKLATHIINFDKPEEWENLVKGDVLFSCLGTTLKTAGSKEAQWKIDYDYQYQFAEIAKKNGINQYVLVSSAMASSKSSIFYTKMKGQLEDAVKLLGFPKLIIFKPPLLLRENSNRKAEIIGAKLIKFFNKIGLFSSQKPLSTKCLAEVMLKSVKTLKNGKYIFDGQEILKFYQKNDRPI
jgi:uncharacterized protein YbjT (DUF2867 family)